MLPKRGREDDDPRVRCSKTLSYLLRHGAVQSGLKMTSDGYAAVADILAFPQFKDCTAEMIRDLVANDAKTRYSLRDADGKMEICANQGHSLAGKIDWILVILKKYFIAKLLYMLNWNGCAAETPFDDFGLSVASYRSID